MGVGTAGYKMLPKNRFFFAGVVVLTVIGTACDPPGKPGPEPTPPDKVTDFQTLFSARCAGCHGPEGRHGAARILNDPLYLAVIPRDTLRDVIAHGRAGTAMPAWAVSEGGPLADTQINALVDGMYKNWGKPDQFQGKTLPSYAAQGLTGDADRGRKLFARDCFACHGPGAPIGSVTDVAYTSLVTNQMLRTSIIVGQPDYGMPDYRFLNMGHALSDQDIADLVAFISSKRPISITQQYEQMQTAKGQETTRGNEPGQQAGGAGQQSNVVGSGQGGSLTKGNEGSGTGPGSRHQQQREGNKSTAGSSERGSNNK